MLTVLLVDRYEIVRPIKSGGMGAVYLAKDLRLGGSPCAVKAMLEACKNGENSESILRKFQSESVVLSHLQHAGIPRVRDYFIEGDTAYIVMDFIEGENLEHELTEALAATEKPLDVDWAVQACLEVLDILIYLHGLPTPVIHCDIKPANLIREAKTKKIMLVDFGLARSLESAKTQTVAGTLGYSALEQLRGHAEPRSDLYALGVTLFHMLTGKAPVFLQVPSVRDLRPDLDPRLAAVVDHATKLEVEERIGSAAEMRQLLQGWLDNRHLQPSQHDLDRAASLAAGPTETPPKNIWEKFQRVLSASFVPAKTGEVAQEPCPKCNGLVKSDQARCGRCGHKMDPEPLQLGAACREAAQLLLTTPTSATLTLALCLILQLSLRFQSKVASFWLWPFWFEILTVPCLLLGFCQAVVSARVAGRKGELPPWGDGFKHLFRGVTVLGLAILMLVVPTAPFLGLEYMVYKISKVGAISFPILISHLVLSMAALALFVRQSLAFPWSWASLGARGHIPTALDTGAYVLQKAARYQVHFAFLLVNFSAILLSCLALNSLPYLWFLASFMACWGAVYLADLTACLFQNHFPRKLANWPSSFRSIFGESPSGLTPESTSSRPPLLFALLFFLAVAGLMFGVVIPSRDRHLFPMFDRYGRVGYFNRYGWVVIEPQFQAANPFDEKAVAAPVKFRNKWGYIKRDGTWLVEAKFESAGPFTSDGLAQVLNDNRWGYLDETGRLAIDHQFTSALPFKDGTAFAQDNRNSWGKIDKSGIWVQQPSPQIQPEFPPEKSTGPLTLALEKDYYTYKDSRGRVVNSGQYTRACEYSQGLALVFDEYKLGYIDEKGVFVFGVSDANKVGDTYLLFESLLPVQEARAPQEAVKKFLESSLVRNRAAR